METEFIAYAGDCRVKGFMDLDPGARLSDALNGLEELTLRRTRLMSHADGHVLALDQVTIPRDDLFAIEAAVARGEPARRVHTVKHRVELDLGPYRVTGSLHSLPGNPPLVSIRKRAPMIPLTGATIHVPRVGGGEEAHEVGVLIVNRWLADSVRTVEPEHPALLGWNPLGVRPPTA